MRTFTAPLTALILSGGLLGTLLAASCSDDELSDRYPPGTGGFDPGTETTNNGSGSGYGANGPGATGTGGMIEPGPPQCDDAQKECEHEFSYQDTGTETAVEVRGSFDGWGAGAPLVKQGSEWTGVVKIPYNQEVQYKFVINGTDWIPDPGNPLTADDGFGGVNSVLSPTTCDPWTCKEVLPGSFWHDAVLYFVFVDRFRNGNPGNDGNPTPGVQEPADYHGGDWAGVRQKIADNYFTDLGVNVLWLSVPADNTEQSGQGIGEPHQYSAYHGYWPDNLEAPEERFGTMQEMQMLVQEAHAKGIKVIVDYAMNHVHSSSPIYQQHQSDGWFWPNDNGSGGDCVCGQGCSWDGDQGKRCWFTSYLPDFNFNNADARSWSVDNAIWWIQETGIDGYRLDAVKHIEDQWLLDLRARVASEIEPALGEHFYMVGETFDGNHDVIARYVDPDEMLSGQFDFPLRASIVSTLLMRQGSMNDLVNALNLSDSKFAGGLMSTFIGNHDVPRSIHFAEDTPVWDNAWAGGKEIAWNNKPGAPGGASAYERLGNAFTFIFTNKGVPLIYYGDEVGLAGAGDPDNRRDMPWTAPQGGAAALFAHVKKLGQIRKDHPALRTGSRQILAATADTLTYSMANATETLYIAINRSDASQQVGGLPSGQLTDLLTNAAVSGPTITVPARSSMILRP